MLAKRRNEQKCNNSEDVTNSVNPAWRCTLNIVENFSGEKY
jgi:hypothetical protein